MDKSFQSIIKGAALGKHDFVPWEADNPNMTREKLGDELFDAWDTFKKATNDLVIKTANRFPGSQDKLYTLGWDLD